MFFVFSQISSAYAAISSAIFKYVSLAKSTWPSLQGLPKLSVIITGIKKPYGFLNLMDSFFVSKSISSGGIKYYVRIMGCVRAVNFCISRNCSS